MIKKLLEQLKSGFKRTIKWNKYRSQMTIQSNNNNLIFLIDQHLLMLTDCLFCHLQELQEKIMQQNIVEILFHNVMYHTPK